MTEEIEKMREELVDNTEGEMEMDGSTLSAEIKDNLAHPRILQISDVPSKKGLPLLAQD